MNTSAHEVPGAGGYGRVLVIQYRVLTAVHVRGDAGWDPFQNCNLPPRSSSVVALGVNGIAKYQP